MKTEYNSTRTVFVLLGISIISFAIIFMLTQEKQALKEKNNVLEAKNNTLTSENGYLIAEPLLNDKRYSYQDWKGLNDTAIEFVEDSNGKFKKSWAFYLIQEAKAFNINPHIMYELLKVETGGTFNPKLVGPKTIYGHAYGMAQFMKNTAPWIANKAGLPYEDKMLFDPYYSIHLSFVYLDFLKEQYGNWNKALTAYHRGMGGLENYVEQNGHAKSWYALEILTNAKQGITIAN
ncbi:lytic transglycosylase domain-containing protein [Virgibacillus sp. DJP39]|uniref:lytic transglycosylase domain-containing protein n=1 Tax=Virgibacillus sp. DJP39 TaxID=3409790 RepID=UPI003BB7259D